MQMEREKCLEIYLYLNAQIESILMSTCLTATILKKKNMQTMIRLKFGLKNQVMIDGPMRIAMLI